METTNTKLTCKYCDHTCVVRYMIKHYFDNHVEHIIKDNIRMNSALRGNSLVVGVKFENENRELACCLACNKGWVKRCLADKHFNTCDEEHKKEHIRMCKKVKEAHINVLIETQDGAASEALVKQMKEQEKQIKKYETEVKTLKRELKESSQYTVMFKRLIWGLCELYDKEERARIMETLEGMPSNDAYEMDWDGELMVNYNKGERGFTNDFPDEDD